MLFGLLGAALPIAIHLIGRQRAERVRFAAIDFLLGSDEKLSRKLRLRDRLLLLFRILICVAIALTLAKPFTTCQEGGPRVAAGPQAVVLILDDSLASQYERGGANLFTAAQREAYEILSRLDSQAEVALLFTAGESGAAAAFSRNLLQVREQIAARQPTFRGGDIGAALKRAAAILDSSEHAVRTAYLISPLARGLTRAAFARWAAGRARLEVVDLAGGAALENVSIAGIEVTPEPQADGVSVAIKLQNDSPNPTRSEIAVHADETLIARGQVELPAGGAEVKRFSVRLSDERKRSTITLSLAEDALAADNTYRLLVNRAQEVRVLLVNGDPRTVKRQDELFYLKTALRPGDQADSGIAIREASPGELPDLAPFDVVILANVHALAPRVVSDLASWVGKGGGLMVAMGDNVDADAYNKTMLPLLPQRLANRVDLVYGDRGQKREERALRLDKLDYSHPILAVFPKDAPGLVSAEFARVMLLGPTTDIDKRSVLARYDNGAVALIAGQIASGRVLLFTSSLDRDWNDLAIHPGYLPLMQQAVAYLAGRAQARTAGALYVGQPITLPVQSADQVLQVIGPDRLRHVFEAAALDGGTVSFSQTDQPGVYRVEAKNRAGVWQPRPESDFTVNIDPRASDLTRLAIDTTAAENAPGAGTSAPQSRVALWNVVAIALLALLILESLVVLRQQRG